MPTDDFAQKGKKRLQYLNGRKLRHVPGFLIELYKWQHLLNEGQSEMVDPCISSSEFFIAILQLTLITFIFICLVVIRSNIKLDLTVPNIQCL